jgi:adenylate cyclase class 2
VNNTTYEVEMKFRVSDLHSIEDRLREIGAAMDELVVEEDAYFNHPQRDFAKTDEAFRIRRSGTSAWITYKGPKLDHTTKTRQEIEVALAEHEDAYAKCAQIFAALGFRPVDIVRKQRTRYTLDWEHRAVEVTLDDVRGVGTFVELEIRADASNMEAAKSAIQGLAERLQLQDSERRSYLQLLLDARSQ